MELFVKTLFLMVSLYSLAIHAQADLYVYKRATPPSQTEDKRAPYDILATSSTPRAAYSHTIKSDSIRRILVIEEDGSYTHIRFFDQKNEEYFNTTDWTRARLYFPRKIDILAHLAHRKIPASFGMLPDYMSILRNSGGFYNDNAEQKYSLDFMGECESCVFENQAYDSFDYGNLLWGAVVRWLGIDYSSAKLGSEINEFLGSARGLSGMSLSGDSAEEAMSQG